jgi:hypothetical protein
VDAAGGDFAPGMHSPLVDSGWPEGAVDLDGSAADRGLYGGPEAEAAGPAAVAGLQGDYTGGVASLTWEAVAGAASYVVYRDTSAVFVASADLARAVLSAPEQSYQETPPEGEWYYVVGAVDATGRAGGFSGRYAVSADPQTGVGGGELPRALAITGVAPNPFNPRATVSFDVPRAGAVSLRVYDVRGREVATLHEGALAAGRHEAVWDGRDGAGRGASAGIYFVRLQDGREARTVKAVLAK